MATFITRLTQSRSFQVARTASRQLFGRYLLVTNICISTGLSGTGDIIQQHYEIVSREKKLWDRHRTSNMSVAGATVGVVCHYWYIWLDRWLPGKTLPIVLKKVAVDQLLLSPVIIVVFFATIGLLEGHRVKHMCKEMLGKGSQLYLAEWLIWPPAQLFNFYVLPTRFRVLYDNSISLGFDIYTSHVVHKKDPDCEDDQLNHPVQISTPYVDSSRDEPLSNLEHSVLLIMPKEESGCVCGDLGVTKTLIKNKIKREEDEIDCSLQMNALPEEPNVEDCNFDNLDQVKMSA